MEYKLNVHERVIIMSILPQESSYTTMKIIRDLKNLIGIKDEEYKKFEIKEDDGKFSWGKEGNKELSFEIGEKAADLIIEPLKKLDKSKKLKTEQFSLYEKFVKD